jgi:4'-phosphopantetheinyl transferase
MFPSEMKDIFDRLDEEIHVWSSQLDQPNDVIEHYRQILGERDRARIERYKTPRLRCRQTVAMGSLVSLIALYTRETPQRIELESGEFRKPVLANNTGRSNLQFSASHSNHIGMYAFTEDKLIGVDLEEIVARSDWQDVMDICLSDYEKDWFSRLPFVRKAATLIQIWTIKEAYLKAIGTGLAVPPASVELEFTETNEYQFHRLRDKGDCASNWKIFSFSPLPGFSAAVVVEAGPSKLHYFCLEPPRLESKKS